MFSEERFRILIVDDISDNLLLLQTLLEAEGYEVETANGGIPALATIEANPPDLVLLDVMMPDLDGYEVTRRIRQNSALPFFPVLLMSAHAQADTVQGLDLGANDFIHKPIDSSELVARVKAFLESGQQSARSRTVLVVEDNYFDALHLERVLGQLNSSFVTHRVERAEDAISYLRGEGNYSDRTRHPLPDFVVLDLRLPGMSGLDFLRWLRHQPSLRQLQVISVTGHGNRDLSQAYDLGIKFYLLKPIEVDTLTDVLQGLSLV